MNKIVKIKLLVLMLLGSIALWAQRPAGAPGGAGAGQDRNIGRFYGKVVDENEQGVGYAAVQLYAMRMDTATGSLQERLIDGQITEENGDFSLEKLPVFGEFTLRISYLGYETLEKKVSFGLTREAIARQRAQGGPPAGNRRPNMSAMASRFDVDLGNISLVTSSQLLDEVVVTGEAGAAILELDRKIFRVDKNAVAAGGTAEDALRNIPSLSVDIDGNVTVRNASPQIFVDGRPTTLSLDQIPADAIESVEVITNPSAKYDASGGQGGILNIVMKKDRRIGYNGNLRAGVDSRGGINAGGNINAREGKVNGFLSGFFNQRRSFTEGELDRNNLFGDPPTNLFQDSESNRDGFFAMGRGGIDWFMDNRNTLTFSGMYMRGQFNSDETIDILVDSLFQGTTTSSQGVRITDNDRNFRNMGGSILYKRLFPKAGRELTADINFNQVRFTGNGDYRTESNGSEILEQQENDNTSRFITIQSDYVDPLSDDIKVEAGVRAALRRNDNSNSNLVYDPVTGEWAPVQVFANTYNFNDDVYAAYATFSHQMKKWGYQLGLRAESSQYTGNLPDADTSFTNDFPLSLFPSAFVTYQLNETDNIQVSYTRRVNRPNFFQLMPFTDFTDPFNLRRGNANLRPEFTNSFELNYQNIFAKGHNLLITAYYKDANDLITAYQFSEYNEVIDQEVLVNSYANSNGSKAYGVEITLRNNLFKNVELTSNVNMYQSEVDASNVETDLVNKQFTWFVKENLTVKLPAQFTLQVSGEYQSPAAFTPSGGGRFRGWGGSTNTAQGYTIGYWFVDMALRKDLFDRKASLTLSMQDIFRSRRTGAYTESDFFIQDNWRLRNPQLLRLNFSYRFGKMDASLFKRKNTNQNNEGMDMM